MRRTARGLALALVVTAFSATARADEAGSEAATEARQQYQMGTQAFSAKRYSEAALHFEAAAALKPSAIALYTAGLAWDLASRPERAADAYVRSLDVPGLDGKQTSIAKERVNALEKTLGVLAVTAPATWRVQLDTLTEVDTPARLHGSPGVHTLNVRRPDGPIERRDVTLEAGKVEVLGLEGAPEAPVESPEPVEAKAAPPHADLDASRAPEPFWNTVRVVGVGVAGVGIAALGAGVVFGANAADAKDAYEASPTRVAFDHASALETWTNVAFVSGSVLLVGGAALVFLPILRGSERGVKVGAAPGGLTFGGSF